MHAPQQEPALPGFDGADALVTATARGDDVARVVAATIDDDETGKSGQATAKLAIRILRERNEGFIEPTAVARRHVSMAFAGRGKVVYGKAFDVIRVVDEAAIDFNDLSSVERHLDNIILYEIKSTRKNLREDFAGYFFSLSTAELLVAQSLGTKQFRFAFVDTKSGKVLEQSLTEVFARAKAIYPTWSISF